MNILLVGHNTTTHFMSNYLLSYNSVDKVYHCNSKPGILSTDRYIPITLPAMDKSVLLESLDLSVDLVIPTQPVMQIWREYQQKIKGIPHLMPPLEGGELEFSKIKTKELLKRLDIPSPDYRVYSQEDFFKNFLSIPRPFVFKFNQDWRFGRQTIIVTDENYKDEYDDLIKEGTTRNVNVLGPFKNQKFIVEEYVEGTEYSYHALCNSQSTEFIGAARDYKKYKDGDLGSNTGGMGSYNINTVHDIVHLYAERITNYFKDIGDTYVGFLFLGILVKKDGTPMVLEINTRPGDPEMQAIMPCISNNLVDLFYNAANNHKIDKVSFNNLNTVVVKLVSKRFFDNPHINPKLPADLQYPIFTNIPNDIILSYESTETMTCYASLTCTKSTRKEAADTIYRYLKTIDVGDFTYRTDIGLLS